MTIYTFSIQVLKRYPRQVIGVVLLLVLVSLLEMAGMTTVLPLLGTLFGNRPEFSGAFGDFVEQVGILNLEPYTLLLLVVGVIVGKSMLHGLATYVIGLIGVRIEKDLKSDLMQAILGADWIFFINQHVGSTTSIITKETEQVKVAITIFGQFLSMIVISSILFLGMAFVSFPVFLGTLAMGSMLLWTVRKVQARSLEIAHRRVGLDQRLSGSIIETISLLSSLRVAESRNRDGGLLTKLRPKSLMSN